MIPNQTSTNQNAASPIDLVSTGASSQQQSSLQQQQNSSLMFQPVINIPHQQVFTNNQIKQQFPMNYQQSFGFNSGNQKTTGSFPQNPFGFNPILNNQTNSFVPPSMGQIPRQMSKKNQQRLTQQQPDKAAKSISPTDSDKYQINRMIEDQIDPIHLKAKDPKDAPIFDYNELKLEVHAPYQLYRLEKSLQTIPIKITLKTEVPAENLEKDLQSRSSIDLICVVDVSGSMSGNKIHLVKETLKYVLSLLNKNDRLSLVVFNDNSSVSIALKRASNENEILFNNIFESLCAGGGTNINSGVSIALDVIQSRKWKNEITSIFLLSDGNDNIREKALPIIQTTIREKNIKGQFTINTFGFGSDHDANLMCEVAKQNGGNFYFVDDIESIDECFVDAMGLLFSVVLKDIKLNVKVNNQIPLSDMRIKKTYGSMWTYDDKTSAHNITIKLFTKGMKKDYICELNIPPCKKELLDEEKNRLVLKVRFEGKTVQDENIQKKTDFFLTFINDKDEMQGVQDLNTDVFVNHLRVKGAEAIDLSKTLLYHGHYVKAEKELTNFLKELEECPCKDHPSLIILKADIEKSLQFCKEGKLSNEGMSYLTSFSNNNMAQQSCPMSKVGNIVNPYSNKMQSKMNSDLSVKKSGFP